MNKTITPILFNQAITSGLLSKNLRKLKEISAWILFTILAPNANKKPALRPLSIDVRTVVIFNIAGAMKPTKARKNPYIKCIPKKNSFELLNVKDYTNVGVIA